MHVTFNYGRLYKFPENIVGKEVEVIIVGYGSDGLNSGFAVEIPEELNKFYKNVYRISSFLLYFLTYLNLNSFFQIYLFL